MPTDPQPLPSRFLRTPFLVADALEQGVGRERLRRKDLAAPARGVRVPADRLAFIDTALAHGLLLRPDQHFSHTTAARLWSAPLPRLFAAPNSELHVSTTGSGPVERRQGVIGHRVRPSRADVTTVFGVRVSTPAAFWYECRTLLSLRALVILGDHLVGVGRLASPAQLAATIHPGDRAVVLARAALDLVRVGAESPMETIVRLIVVEAGFPEPDLNADVFDASGRFIGRVDMAWVELRIALEYDGDHHRTDRDTFSHDRTRGNAFTVASWLTIHVTAKDAHHPSDFLERLREAFALRQRNGVPR
ncbi:hypothetical protein [Curtobacterium sp. ZW137]|uniref:hypothetical protein n=1 Tax=Curtobacterium sp. ZW137 TaxID=2485104 RepID=UPI000F4B3D30|nr:hypothetical protein [Curtobacterium sp. ZW137]ROP58834.1 hypothetical protein EDF55_3579 [Curtobacterium sp. ZW137]